MLTRIRSAKLRASPTKRQVSRMQVAHRRHQGDALAAAAPGADLPPQGCNFFDQLHGAPQDSAVSLPSGRPTAASTAPRLTRTVAHLDSSLARSPPENGSTTGRAPVRPRPLPHAGAENHRPHETGMGQQAMGPLALALLKTRLQMPRSRAWQAEALGIATSGRCRPDVPGRLIHGLVRLHIPGMQLLETPSHGSHSSTANRKAGVTGFSSWMRRRCCPARADESDGKS